MRVFEGKDNYGKPKSDYVTKVSDMDYEKLLEETESKIWLSAYASNNPRSDYHWHIDVCYDEILKRDGNDSGYVKAYNNAKKR